LAAPISPAGICTFGSLDDGVGMGHVISLNRVRKQEQRKEAAKQAETNRARFGRTKSERKADELRKARDSDLLDQHRIDGGDAS
jgi:uncharacterized protein DUF4169